MKVLVNYSKSEGGYLAQVSYYLKAEKLVGFATQLTYTLSELIIKAKHGGYHGIICSNQDTLKLIAPDFSAQSRDYTGYMVESSIPIITYGSLTYIFASGSYGRSLPPDLKRLLAFCQSYAAECGYPDPTPPKPPPSKSKSVLTRFLESFEAYLLHTGCRKTTALAYTNVARNPESIDELSQVNGNAFTRRLRDYHAQATPHDVTEFSGILDELLDRCRAREIQQLTKEGEGENPDPVAALECMVPSTSVLTRLEARILRALFDDDGRAIHSYQNDYYRPALASLLAKGCIAKADRGFSLTLEGHSVTKDYLLGVMKRLDASESSSVR